MWAKIIPFIPSWVTLFQAGLALIIPLGIYYVNTSIYSLAGSKGGIPNNLLTVRFLIKITMFEGQQEQPESISKSFIKESLMPLTQISEVTDMEELHESILLGHTALLIEGMKETLLVGSPNSSIRLCGTTY